MKIVEFLGKKKRDYLKEKIHVLEKK